MGTPYNIRSTNNISSTIHTNHLPVSSSMPVIYTKESIIIGPSPSSLAPSQYRLQRVVSGLAQNSLSVDRCIKRANHPALKRVTGRRGTTTGWWRLFYLVGLLRVMGECQMLESSHVNGSKLNSDTVVPGMTVAERDNVLLFLQLINPKLPPRGTISERRGGDEARRRHDPFNIEISIISRSVTAPMDCPVSWNQTTVQGSWF